MAKQQGVFEILGLPRTREISAIKRAYAQKAKEFHPEENPQEWEKLYRAYQTALRYAASEEGGFLPDQEAEFDSESEGKNLFPEEKNFFEESVRRSEADKEACRRKISKVLQKWLLEDKVRLEAEWKWLFALQEYRKVWLEAKILEPLLLLIQKKRYTLEAWPVVTAHLTELCYALEGQQAYELKNQVETVLKNLKLEQPPQPRRFAGHSLRWLFVLAQISAFYFLDRGEEFYAGVFFAELLTLLILAEAYQVWRKNWRCLTSEHTKVTARKWRLVRSSVVFLLLVLGAFWFGMEPVNQEQPYGYEPYGLYDLEDGTMVSVQLKNDRMLELMLQERNTGREVHDGFSYYLGSSRGTGDMIYDQNHAKLERLDGRLDVILRVKDQEVQTFRDKLREGEDTFYGVTGSIDVQMYQLTGDLAGEASEDISALRDFRAFLEVDVKTPRQKSVPAGHEPGFCLLVGSSFTLWLWLWDLIMLIKEIRREKRRKGAPE